MIRSLLLWATQILAPNAKERNFWSEPRRRKSLIHIRWHYLSNATCLIRPHLFYVCFAVPRITIICYIACRFRRKPALDK